MVEQSKTVAIVDEPAAGWALAIQDMRHRLQAVQQLYRDVMVRGTDYDTIPGTDKPTLLQPGAQILDMMAGNAPVFEEMPGCIRDWERGFFHFEIRCKLVRKATGEVVAEGLGACNSKEDRYRWRQARPICPVCQKEAIARSKQEWGGGYYCNRKAGGCGASFKKDDERVANQPVGRVENDEPFTLVNTLLKMSQKRAHVAATLNATGASRIFTQDVEDLVPPEEAPRPPSPPARPAPRAPSRPPAAPPEAPENDVEPPDEDPSYVEEAHVALANTPARQRLLKRWEELWGEAALLGIDDVPPLAGNADEAEITRRGQELAIRIKQAKQA